MISKEECVEILESLKNSRKHSHRDMIHISHTITPTYEIHPALNVSNKINYRLLENSNVIFPVIPQWTPVVEGVLKTVVLVPQKRCKPAPPIITSNKFSFLKQECTEGYKNVTFESNNSMELTQSNTRSHSRVTKVKCPRLASFIIASMQRKGASVLSYEPLKIEIYNKSILKEVSKFFFFLL